MGRGERYGRRSIRLKGYDYTRDGAYFVTACTQDRAQVFGTVVDGVMQSNSYGRAVANCWLWLVEQYPYVRLDEWIVMPDHIHGIVVITDGMNTDGPCRGGSRTALKRISSTTGSLGQTTDGMHVTPAQRKPLGRLIGAFKSLSTQRVNDLRDTPGAKLWQRNYYEHVIRNGESLQAARRYIIDNPLLQGPGSPDQS